MSPRRKIEPGSEPTTVIAPVAKRDWRESVRRARGLPALGVFAPLLVVAAITLSGLMLRSHLDDHRSSVEDAAVLGYVGQFMTEYTTLDPFHANDYADRIVANAVGDFAKQFKEKENAIVVQVAQAEPTKGAVLDAGIEKRHDDGSVSVLVATKITTTVGDQKKPVESGNRWVVTAVKEGQQWKISQLTQVI
jgi:Mce-associated membrane protein